MAIPLSKLQISVLVSLLIGAPALALAAEAPIMETLPGEVSGVIGSGDQLSLKLGEGPNTRTLRVGEIYRDGWRLQAVTPTEATLTREGESRKIGLNPAGALAQAAPAGPPSTVTVAGGLTEATIDLYWNRYLAKLGLQPGERPRGLTGLTLEEDRRRAAYQGLLDDYIAAHPEERGITADYARAVAIFGKAAVDEYMALSTKDAEGTTAQLKAKAEAMTTADWQVEANGDQRNVDFYRAQLATMDTADPKFAQYTTSLTHTLENLQIIKGEHGVSPQPAR